MGVRNRRKRLLKSHGSLAKEDAQSRENSETAFEKRIDHQVRQSTDKAISELPTTCDRNTNKMKKATKCHGQRTLQGDLAPDAGVISLFADQLLRLIGKVSKIDFLTILVAVHFA